MERDTYDRFRLAAMIAEMEGMIAENQACKCTGRVPTYTEDAFIYQAMAIRDYCASM
jgi:hypothetical protein